jgi:hypothetical protein
MAGTRHLPRAQRRELNRRLAKWVLWVPLFAVLLPLAVGLIMIKREESPPPVGTLRTLLGGGELFLASAILLGTVTRDLADLRPRPELAYFAAIFGTVVSATAWGSGLQTIKPDSAGTILIGAVGYGLSVAFGYYIQRLRVAAEMSIG